VGEELCKYSVHVIMYLGMTIVEVETVAEVNCETTQLTVTHTTKRPTLQTT